jgi:hypothetical protein
VSRIYDTLVGHLRAAGLPVEEHAERGFATVSAVGSSGRWILLAQAFEDRDQAVIYSMRVEPVPPERREPVALLLTRANYGLFLGNFEMDLDDGEVRFKTSLDFGGVEPSDALVQPLVGFNVATMDRYLPAIDAVVDGGDVDTVIAALESAG